LVIGTHGRAIYVIDDIRPLRELARSPGLLAAPLHLFDPPPTYLRGVAAVDGYHFSGDAMFRGETRPQGAILTYSVGPGNGEESATIEILDAAGEVLRSVDGSANPGLNRVVWDLKEDNPFPQSGGGWFQPTGPEVLPGTYDVRVRVGAAEASTTVEVRADPRVEISLADRILKRDAVREGYALIGTLQEIQDRMRDVHQGLGLVEERLEDRQDEQARELRELADSVRADAGSLAEAIDDVEENSFSVFFMAFTRDAPTEADRITLMRMEESLGRLVSRFNAFLSGRVGDYRQQVEAAGLGVFPDLRPVQRPAG
jgi:hypothetical protein